MKKLFSISILCFSIYTINAQRDFTYSEILETEELIFKNVEKNPELSYKLAVELSTGTLNNKKNDSLKILGHGLIGEVYHFTDKIDMALSMHRKNYKFFVDDPSLIKKYTELFINESGTLVNYEIFLGNYNIASEIIYKCLSEIKNKPKYNYERSRLLELLGFMHHELGNFDKSKVLLHESIKYTNKTNNTRNKESRVIKANCNETLGDIYSESNLDSAFYYYNETKKYYDSGIYMDRPAYNIRTKIARLHIKKGELKKAKTILKEVEQFYTNQKIKKLEYYYLAQIEIAVIEGDIDKEYSNLVDLDSTIIDNKDFFINLELHNKYVAYFSKIKNFKSLNKHNLLVKKYTDSLYNKSKIFAANEVELKYKTDLKNAEIKAKEKQKKGLIIGFSIGLVLLSLSGLFYFQKQRTEKRLAIQKMTNLLESEKLNTIKSQLIGQNIERERIAKDLHDSVSGNIAAIKLKLSQIKTQTIDIQNITNDLDNTYKEVRSISHDLLPKEILKEGFVSLVEQLIDSRKTKSLAIEAEFVTEESINKLPEKVQLEIYTILKELLTNIHKHADATLVFINVIHYETSLSVTVEDNGKGFNVDNAFEGIGIKNIKSRLKTIKGKIEIESSTSNGTNINMEINLI